MGNFQIHSVSCDTASFETLLLHFEFLGTIQDIGIVLVNLEYSFDAVLWQKHFPFKRVTSQLRCFH